MSTVDSAARESEREPGVAAAERGLVLLDGPDGISVTMTADAAEGTARSLLAAVAAARTQQVDEEPH